MDFSLMILNHSTPLTILAVVIVMTLLKHTFHLNSRFHLSISILTGICVEILDTSLVLSITISEIVTGALSGMIAYFCYESILKIVKTLK